MEEFFLALMFVIGLWESACSTYRQGIHELESLPLFHFNTHAIKPNPLVDCSKLTRA